jgi:murein DD-endopeptidase MepM/ murein hydrolase activator NlpD
VTTAGSGRASGWAGTYVVIKHSDGTSSLYAHMSSVDVSVGDDVDAGRVIGRVGQTGRAFGPHLHFEIYPAGVEAGDVYNAVDPWPWLRDLGL